MRVVGFASSIVVIASSVVVVAACGDAPVIVEGEGDGDGEEGEGEEGDVVDARAYCEELAPIFCPFYLRCGRMNVDDEDACAVAFAEACEVGFEPRFTPLADLGLLTLSRAGLDACAAHLDDAACDTQFLELSGPCAQVWRGAVDTGGACGLDAESFVCAPGTTCTLDLSFCGVCEAVLDVGAPCRDVEGSCGPAGFCSDSDVCVARPVVGEGCTDVPCVLPAQCEDGVCREPAVVGVGDVCDRDHRCPYRSRCDGVCTATVGHGAACAADEDCDAVCEAAAVGDFGPVCTEEETP